MPDVNAGAPADGRVWSTGDCSKRVFRSGGFLNGPSTVRSAFRNGAAVSDRSGIVGFRLASTLAPPPQAKAIDPQRVPDTGQSFRDCAECPEMVVVPAGRFVIGSPASEPGRSNDEGPRHLVTIANPFAVGKFEVTFEEWNTCVREGQCAEVDDQEWGRGRRPVINVDWKQAIGYAKWLADKTGKKYRLLSEAEWEYAARAGSEQAWFWGSSPERACEYANVYDVTGKAKLKLSWEAFTCDDRYSDTAPVGSFKPNAFGLHDMLGNVTEWVEDCYNGTYDAAPSNGRVWSWGNCSAR